MEYVQTHICCFFFFSDYTKWKPCYICEVLRFSRH